jgi:hypothetical protein
VAAAIANNDYQRAAALYDEFKNAQNVDLKNAQILAEFGDFSGYSRLYGEDQAKNMFYIWAAQNPNLALNAGRITAAQRDNLVNGRPINEGLDASGNRIAPISSGGGYSDPWDYGGPGWNGNPEPAPTTELTWSFINNEVANNGLQNTLDSIAAAAPYISNVSDAVNMAYGSVWSGRPDR